MSWPAACAANWARNVAVAPSTPGGWDTGLTILTALGQLLPFLSEEETHLALLHGARRVAADCDGAPPRREREPVAGRPDLATLKRWLRRWVAVRHRDAAERTVLTAIGCD